jgi:TonB family protein
MGIGMMNVGSSGNSPDQQSDRLLWVAAAIIAGLGVTWLLISQPWSGSSPGASAARLTATRTPAPAPTVTPAEAIDAARVRRAGLADPLRMAELAYDAGMLTEPEDYSAWKLFAEVHKEDPDNAAARQGLEKVAAVLLQRGNAAFEQGRYDDARAAAERILSELPAEAHATDLVERLDAATAEPEPAPQLSTEPSRPQPSTSVRPAPEVPRVVEQAKEPAPKAKPEPEVDRVAEAHEAFELAMRENRLLTPKNNSAVHHVATLIDLEPSNELTRSDRNLLVDELLARSTQAMEALDTEAATTWIEEAERLATDQSLIVAARMQLTDHLVAMESAKNLPASELSVTSYTAPKFPFAAAQRGIEGWVDIEFTVAEDGTTRDVVVADGSHDRFFRTEAIEAVEQWRFQPRRFMDRNIAQRAHTRLRFVLSE